jgi:hypothetical protein
MLGISRSGRCRAKSGGTPSTPIRLFPDKAVLSSIVFPASYPDKVRGIFNEGGLFSERQGWHLPGYPTTTSSWSSRDLALGLPDSRNGGVGVGSFVTTFELGIPEGFDVMLSFTFEEARGQGYRAILFVNGWMMGKRVGNLG